MNVYTQPTKPKKKLRPPIYVKGTMHSSELRNAISNEIGSDSFMCKSTTTRLKIQTNSSNNYRISSHIYTF